MGQEGLRNRKKTEIETCLLKMMSQVPYEEITVKDLTDKLGMARKTFYHYYSGKNDCLESMMDRIVGEYNLMLLLETQGSSDLSRLYEKRIRFWMEYKPYLDVINQNRLEKKFLDRFMIYLQREDWELPLLLGRPHLEYDEDILSFFLSGYLYLLLKWCREGFSLPIEEMVRKSIRLLHEPLLLPRE